MLSSESLFEIGLVLALIGAAAVAASIGGRFRPLKRRLLGRAGWRDRAAARQPLILMDDRGAMQANRSARAMFGGLPAGPTSPTRLLERIGGDQRGAFAAQLDDLVANGIGFETEVDTDQGRRLSVIGEARGDAAALAFHDITSLHQAATDAAQRAASLNTERAELDRALAAAGVAAARIDAAGRELWSNASWRALSEAGRTRLLRDAATPGAPREMSVDGAVFAINATEADNGERMICARVISENTGGEEAFRRFVNTMAETFAHLKVGLMIFDQQKRLTLFNPATVVMFGGDAAWFARRPTLGEILDHMREARALPEQKDYAAWRDALLKQFDDASAQEYVNDWHLTDGRTIHVIARPHPSGGLAVTAEDITESIDLLRSSATEKAVMLATTEFLEEALIVFGPDGLSRVTNAAFLKLWGYAPDAFAAPVHITEVSRHCAAQCRDSAYWTAVRESVTTGASRRKSREKVALKNGVITRSRYSPMPDGSSLLVMSDITVSEWGAETLRERNEALEQADEIRGALIYQISHQMRTPFNAVFGFYQLLSHEGLGDLTGRRREYLEGIVASAGDLLDAINGMTDLISVGADTMSLEGEPLDPVETMTEMISLASRRSDARDIVIKPEDMEGAGPFHAHRIRLRQIFFNLIMDAFTKSSENAPVRLSLSMDGRTLVTTCEHIQSDEMDEGGLALSLIRRFSSLHGGAVDVVSGEDGRRRVICRLPEAERRAAPRQIAEERLAARV